MQEIVFEDAQTGFYWLDLINPEVPELEKLAERLKVPSTLVQDSLDPEHLPKFEDHEGVSFIIVRCYEEGARKNSDSVRELTHKVAIFASDQFVVTLHRKELDFLKRLKEKWKKTPIAVRPGPRTSKLQGRLVGEIMRETFQSYRQPIEKGVEILEAYEAKIFREASPRNMESELYHIKRKAYIYRRMSRYGLEVVSLARESLGLSKTLAQDLLENGEKIQFLADQLLENAQQLLGIHLSLATHRTNEVMRVLTIFSVFFMPLTFIVGIYGMNFRFMPELEHPLGYLGIWILMIAVTAGIFLWFKHKGWLQK